MNVKQGDVVWISPTEANGLRSDYTHPYLIIHEDFRNTVVVCELTSNMKRAKEPGNVLLETGEANLPRQSVVVTSKEFTLDKTMLGQYIGTVKEHRISEVLTGLRFLNYMTQHHALGKSMDVATNGA